MHRNGYPEDTWWCFSYSPQRDDDGTVVGMLNVYTDATPKVLSEIRHAFWPALETEFWIFDDPSRIQTAAVRALGRHLRVYRAATLTHRLLAFSRRQTLAPKVTDVKALVGGMEDLIVRTVGPSIAFAIRHDIDLWPSMVDPSQLENALLNLCIDARDAMPDGGTLTVQTANCRMDGDAARSRGLEPGEYLALTVTDSGSGMTPDIVTKAFDPFFTTQPIGMGTGLERSMVYGFAKQSHGMASIVAQPAQGAAVSLYLPRHVGTVEAIDVSVEPPSFARATAGETVLVADDEPTIRMLVADVLDSLGYSAIEAHDVASGLKVLHSKVRIDLLITDIGLPGGLNGREVADAARVSRPDLKVLFITGYAETAVLSHGHLDPGMHVLTKPFEMETLAARVKELIAASRNT